MTHRVVAILLCLLVFVARVDATLAASPYPSFCKCTCFTNSTIIELDKFKPTSSRPFSAYGFHGDRSQGRSRERGRLDCNDCTRKFCLENAVAECKDAKEENVVTSCFQRQSTKNKAIVYVFCLTTLSLLIYAAAKPWIDKRRAAARLDRLYMSIPNGQ